MTPAEKIILKWYSVNSFMFNTEDDRYYDSNLKEEVLLNIQKELNLSKQYFSVQQIKEKFKNLRDVFVKADTKVLNKENLTYIEKCIFDRMFFLKPHITHKADHTEVSKYESTSSIKVAESQSSATINEKKKYLINVKDNEIIKSKAVILSEIIKSYEDNETQRSCLLFILKSINKFKTCNANVNKYVN